ncbi:MAG: hypothetical protein V4596_10155 [Bdellovibrionota bacterium]
MSMNAFFPSVIPAWGETTMSQYTFLTSALIFLASASSYAITNKIINPLIVDGCTASSDGSWGHCCIEHDISYWIGGTFAERTAADQRLLKCMNNSGGESESQVYYNTVRIFGTHFWAKAWPARDVNTLSQQELTDIQNELRLYRSLGSPLDFEFVVQESIMFESLTLAQRKLINDSLTVYAQSQEYKKFVKDYEQATGEKPITLKYHHF